MLLLILNESCNLNTFMDSIWSNSKWTLATKTSLQYIVFNCANVNSIHSTENVAYTLVHMMKITNEPNKWWNEVNVTKRTFQRCVGRFFVQQKARVFWIDFVSNKSDIIYRLVNAANALSWSDNVQYCFEMHPNGKLIPKIDEIDDFDLWGN